MPDNTFFFFWKTGILLLKDCEGTLRECCINGRVSQRKQNHPEREVSPQVATFNAPFAIQNVIVVPVEQGMNKMLRVQRLALLLTSSFAIPFNS